MRVFVVAGSPEARPPLGLAPAAGDRVIAADLGAQHALRWGWPVHLLIGDLDSLPAAQANALAEAGTPVITAPVAKDETDLELALAYALAEEAPGAGPAGSDRPGAAVVPSIVICAALGGRADHMLANVLLLARADLAGRRILIADGPQALQLLDGAARGGEPAELTIAGERDDLLSLLPLYGDAVGVTTEGLFYPLYDETLYAGAARGVSNVFVARRARVWLRAGRLLVIHTQNQTDRADPER